MAEGEVVWLVFSRDGEGLAASGADHLQGVLDATVRHWRAWSHTEEVTRYPAERFWGENLDRAALVMKLLQFEDTGAIAAGGTSSLPTILYGERNWDYRFSWIRDTAMTLAALFELGHSQEVSRYLDWLKQLCAHEPPGQLRIMYQLTMAEPPCGETRTAASGRSGLAPTTTSTPRSCAGLPWTGASRSPSTAACPAIWPPGAEILEKGYSAKRGAFTQHYDTDELNASVVMIPIVGFLPVDDPRVASTIAAIEDELLVEGTMLRYRMDEGLPNQENGFLICLFWYVDCLILQERLNEAGAHLRRIDRFSHHLGLFGEQYDPRYKEITGNLRQAYSHIGFAITAINYLNARRTRSMPEHTTTWRQRLGLLFRPWLLNPEPEGHIPAPAINPAEEIKRTVNTLRGYFYDNHRQRVNYRLVRGSGYYPRFEQAAADLAAFDPGTLETDAERTAFWVNVFNAIIIHGVIELGIRDSIREVSWFFRAIRYKVGDHTFTPDDIEHGILRGNRRGPYRLRRQFGAGDPAGAWPGASPIRGSISPWFAAVVPVRSSRSSSRTSWGSSWRPPRRCSSTSPPTSIGAPGPSNCRGCSTGTAGISPRTTASGCARLRAAFTIGMPGKGSNPGRKASASFTPLTTGGSTRPAGPPREISRKLEYN